MSQPEDEPLTARDEVEVAVLWAHQEAWARRRFGEDVSLNVGSFTHVHDDGVTVSTKVYGHGVLTTTSRELGVFEDEWQEIA